VLTCPACGQENPDGFRFCGACASPLGPSAPAEVVRKTVTLVFSDIAGSTAMGEGRDPEAIRGAMDRYFAEMRAIVERHGGIVEKFVGDAVMAAFGIPVVHEDDALRAVRTAAEMRERLATLNDELERDWGVRLNARIGVNTGEVVAGDPSDRQTFATGDTVNTAARLEQHAPPNEVLVSASTLELVRDAVEVEAVEPLTVKGKAEPVPAFRLVGVDPLAAGRTRRSDLDLIGREDELGSLQRAFAEVVRERRCRLATVLGAPGVGKSRVIHELSRRIGDDARVFWGRCLPYGEGITFFPLAEVVRAAAGIADEDAPERALDKVGAVAAAVPEGDTVVAGVAAALDLGGGSMPIDQVIWSLRRWLELLAAGGPTVVVLDDLQWAEDVLLELVDHVARHADGPLFIAVMARPELIERRPDWGADVPGSTRIDLGPLVAEVGRALVLSLLGGDVDPRWVDQVVDAAGGNPLFVEELVAKLVDEGALDLEGGRWHARGDLAVLSMPASIEALLGERIERLHADARSVLESGAVIGQVFYRGAVLEMVPDGIGSRIDEHLAELDRREYIRRSDETMAEELAFAFRHLMIRDAAYRRLSKGLRARLHATFAAWLRRVTNGWSVGHDEIVGYHLERAVRYRAELAPPTDEDRWLARDAAELLAAAGRRAMDRGDVRAASSLLGRATALVPADDPWRLRAEVELARALNEAGRPVEALELATSVEERARASAQQQVAVAASLARAIVSLYTGVTGTWVVDAQARADEALALLGDAGPTRDLVMAEELQGLILASSGRVSGAAAWVSRAADDAERIGDPATAARLRSMVTGSLVLGPTPADEAEEACETLLERIGEYRGARGNALTNLGAIVGLRGDVERARRLIEEGSAMLFELGILGSQMGGPAIRSERFFVVETLYGDLEAAERELRAACEHLEEIGEAWAGTTTYAELALVLCDQGRFADAEAAAERSRATSAEDDPIGEAGWRASLARVLAHTGRGAAAERLAREAVSIIDGTEHLLERADAYRALAEVLDAMDESDGARDAARRAIELYRAKGATDEAHPIRRMTRIVVAAT
jgi:class 3 adenylate cyclase/tetratricopeptide (TPR) repeat protein